ncbi:MAG: sigma-70 family RNA polymerase sigma factor [Planctomycetes bacterium]|nr:sigma-70 family RNA polymerase sigma factor [Planctomycetota bacterium]
MRARCGATMRTELPGSTCTPSPPAVDASVDDLLRPHLPRATAVARRLLGCEHLAADVVQEALVALWRLPAAPIDVRGWLVRAVVLRSRQLRRSLQRRQRHEHEAAHHCALHHGCDNPLHHAYAHELGARLDAALADLPAGQRTAFDLYVATGLDYRGIAAALHLPVGTVRSRLHRARDVLQAALAERPPAAAT